MTARRLAQTVLGCVVLGVGVSMLLAPALGSDGFSTLVHGVSLATGWTFLTANTLVSAAFLGMAWLRGVRPGIGTLVQVLVVGGTITLLLPLLDPEATWTRAAMLVAALPVLATGIALYLDGHLGAGPAEAAALAWDPPLPFAWSYSAVQGGGALLGWQLGAAIGPGTLAVIFLLGPLVAAVGRLAGLDVHQKAPEAATLSG